jgi:16S rRNA (uracil1498-N3)-methyltransferase
VRLLLAPDADQTLIATARQAARIALAIGPEGGFSDQELSLAQQQGFTFCRLGPRVLRAETAPLAALAAVQAVAGDFLS